MQSIQIEDQYNKAKTHVFILSYDTAFYEQWIDGLLFGNRVKASDTCYTGLITTYLAEAEQALTDQKGATQLLPLCSDARAVSFEMSNRIADDVVLAQWIIKAL